MAERNTPIRVLVVDDEPEIRDAYKQILCDTEVNLEMTGFHELRRRSATTHSSWSPTA